MPHPLHRFRKNKGLTLDALAKLSGVSKANLSRIENRRQGTTEDTIRRLIVVSAGKLTAEDFISVGRGEKPSLERRKSRGASSSSVVKGSRL